MMEGIRRARIALPPVGRIALAMAWAAAVLCIAAGSGWGQTVANRTVESLDTYREELEALIDERLKVLIPTENYALRVNVEGERDRAPTVTAEGIPELPGFRQSVRPTAPGRERFRVSRITVRLVIHEDLNPADLSYIRSLVPVLADFEPERGDALDMEVITAETLAEREEGPAAEGVGRILPKEISKLEFRDWVILGALGLLLLILLVVMFRVLFLPKPKPAPVPAPPPPEPEIVLRDELSKEEKALQEQREQERILSGVRKDVVKNMVGRPDLGRQLVRDWQDEPDKLVGLIHALSPRVARQAVRPHLEPEAYQTMESTARSEDAPDLDKLIEITREANLYMIAEELKQPEKMRADPFAFLDELSWGQVAHLIEDEPVKIKAMVLGRIPPEATARILETLPQEMQLEVAVQIGNFHSLPLGSVEEVAFPLADKARHVPDERTVDIEGPKTLVDLIGRTSSDTITYLLKAVRSKDLHLSEEIDKLFFLFESIPLVPDDVLPQALRVLPSEIVIRALQGTDPELMRKVILAFPEQARTGLVTSLRAAQYDLETVADARRQVVAQFQALAQEGKIDLKEISDAWQDQSKAS